MILKIRYNMYIHSETDGKLDMLWMEFTGSSCRLRIVVRVDGFYSILRMMFTIDSVYSRWW